MQVIFTLAALVAFASASVVPRAATCDSSTLDNSTYLYPITVAGTTVADVANATGRGICDIGRENLMADVSIIPNVGQSLVIPPQSCAPDSTSCLITNQNTTRECIYGGPRLYYTVNGDTYTKIANRLNITVASLLGSGSTADADEVLTAGQFLKVPLCSPSQCVLQPYTFEYGVYKDLAEMYGTTVGQIMMLSPTYNYSQTIWENGTQSPPTIDLPINCTLLSSDWTIID